tara:strand:- start:23978 stop:25126 length:1149 start_codon:yes stop_codon:yes gene_type:complete
VQLFYNIKVFGVLVILAISAFGALPTKISLGPISLSAALTAGIAFYFLFAFFISPGSKKVFYFHSPLIFFLIMNVVWFVAGDFDLRSFQRIAIWVGMLFVSINVTSWAVRVDNLDQALSNISSTLSFLSILYFGIVAYQVAFNVTDPATSILLVIFFSFFLSRYQHLYGRPGDRVIILFIFFLALSVNSRIVLLALFSILIIFLLRNGHIKSFLICVLLSFLVFAAVVRFAPAYLGLNGGDNALLVGGYTVNTSGRWYAWQLMIESIRESPFLGHGTDLAPELVGVARWSHPHNDYLRLLHQCGAIGLMAFLIFFIRAHHRIAKRVYRDMSSQRRVFLDSSIYATSGIAIVMITDNPLSYSYVIYFLAVLNALAYAMSMRDD